MDRVFLTVAILLATTSLAVPSASADMQATTYGFRRVTQNSNWDVANQLQMIVAETGRSDQVSFIFRNIGSVSSSICDIHFEQRGADGDKTLSPLVGVASLWGTSGLVDFSVGTEPLGLASGQKQAVQFLATAKASADSSAPILSSGVNPGEWLSITFDLAAGSSYASVIENLRNGLAGSSPSLRIGLHVQAIGEDGRSDSYIDSYEAISYGIVLVPVPGAVMLAAMGLGLVALVQRRAA